MRPIALREGVPLPTGHGHDEKVHSEDKRRAPSRLRKPRTRVEACNPAANRHPAEAE